MMFCVNRGGQRVLIRKDAVRFVEPEGDDSIRIYVDGIGEIVTDTYDVDGFAQLVAGLTAGDLDLA